MADIGKTRWSVRLALAMVPVVALLLAACGSASPAAPAGSAPAVEPAVEAAGGAAPAEIRSVELRPGQPEAYLEIVSDEPLTWYSFRDPEGRLVVELPNAVPAAGVADLYPDTGLVAAVQVEQPDRDGDPLTRLVVATRQDVEHSVAGEGRGLEIQLTPLGDLVEVASAPAAEPAEPAEPPLTYEPLPADDVAAAPVAEEPLEELPVEEAPAMARGERLAGAGTAAAYPSEAGTAEDPFEGPPVTGSPASRLQRVAVEQDDHGTLVRVVGDGQFAYSTFALDDPHRFVIDLAGVVDATGRPAVPVGGVVERVRVGQFRSAPKPISRVVFDLATPLVPSIERTPDALLVEFGELNGNRPGRTASARPASVMPAAARVPPGPAPAPQEPEDEGDPGPRVVMEPEVEVEVETGPDPTLTNQPGEPADTDVQVEVEPEPPVVVAPAMPDRELPGREMPAPPRGPRPDPMDTEPDHDLDAFRGETVEITTPEAPSDAFSTRTLAGGREYVGERLDFSLRDADLVETLRSFAVMSDLNIVIQPGVSGTVTVELQDVPWDQAFEQILKINELSYEVEGNIMRIAPIDVLSREAQQRQELEAAKALSVPLTTVIRRLSYSQATQVAQILAGGGILSQRGNIVVDGRTNTLIIKELPDFIDTVIAVIENLDIPEPLVMIEARIVETRKNFTRTLGIEWGFAGVSSPAFGNTTGLQFPNQGNVEGGVNLLTGGSNGLLDISLGNVLNTFNLDATLQAAENEGLVNILSAPKVQALNNEQASIQSGVQIPIQTVANNTVSVQFVNATLRLDVTPQVTAEGTVLMDINIQKRNPEFGLTVAGATNAPISTKEASTRVIVRDGGTTVIGGIYEVTTNQGEDRVPGLANVPIIGHLFKNRRRSDENSELLIFITPRVVKL